MNQPMRSAGESDAARETTAARISAHEHAEHLRARIAALAEQVAISEHGVAAACAHSERLRPHAADRLQEAARTARESTANDPRPAVDPDGGSPEELGG